jgi:histidinol-phosphate aminotransferase
MYEQAAKTEGLVIRSPHFTLTKGFPVDEVLAAINPKTSIVVFSQPNNPTGTAISREDILTIAKKAPHCAMLVDECYYEFMDPASTVKDVLAELPNIFLTRTFSKTWGLASLRIGYLLSSKENIDALCSVRGPYDINQLSVVALRAALKDSKYVFDFVNEVNQHAKPAFEDFLCSHGIKSWPSSCNFIFCYFDKPNELEASLRERNILVRPKKDADGVLGLRVSIGTMEQTKRLISTLEELLPHMNGNGHATKKRKV